MKSHNRITSQTSWIGRDDVSLGWQPGETWAPCLKRGNVIKSDVLSNSIIFNSRLFTFGYSSNSSVSKNCSREWPTWTRRWNARFMTYAGVTKPNANRYKMPSIRKRSDSKTFESSRHHRHHQAIDRCHVCVCFFAFSLSFSCFHWQCSSTRPCQSYDWETWNHNTLINYVE